MPKIIHLRHVPDSVHRELKARAEKAGLPLSAYVLREVRKIAATPTPEQMRERLRTRSRYRGIESPTDAVRAERDGR
jgi:hypothetical protein